MIWFDLDNSPHVPLFRPIFVILDALNQKYFVTAREFAQTKELLEFWNIEHTMVGGHGGRYKVRKIINLLGRAYALRKRLRSEDATLAVSHGSRAQLVAAKSLGMPSIVMLDYEHTESRIFNTLATHILMPRYIPKEVLAQAGFNLRKLIRYDGFKEQIYLQDFVPNASFRASIGIAPEVILVTLRPPSVTGNYHDARSESLFRKCIEHFSALTSVHCLLVNRTESEMKLIPPEFLRKGNVSVLNKPVDGLQLLWHSDAVISGGGTMNRESALMNVPTFSIFTGKRPYLDNYLHELGKMAFFTSEREIVRTVVIKRNISAIYQPERTNLVAEITELILEQAVKNVK